MSNLPIYDRYRDHGRSTGWKSIQFVEGRVVQLPELNEMQSVAHDNLKELGDILLANGSIVKGLQPIPNDALAPTAYRITAGKIYWQGYILDVQDSSWINIDGSIQEDLGLLITETVETESDNDLLKDPVEGAENNGMAGAYRKIFQVQAVKDNPNAVLLHRLKFGFLVEVTNPPEFDSLNRTLASRTYDESGNYLVEGMSTRLQATPVDYLDLFSGQQLTDLAADLSIPRSTGEGDVSLRARLLEDTVSVNVQSGKAYVMGYRIEKPNPTRILVPKAKTPSSVNNELQIYRGSDITLRFGPVSQLTEATAEIRVTNTLMFRALSTNADAIIADGSVSKIVSVAYDPDASGPISYGYTEGTHFDFVNGEIQWRNPQVPSGGNYNLAPPNGANYTVVYDYTATLEIGTPTDTKDIYLVNATQVRLTGSLGGTPVSSSKTYAPNSELRIDYEYYLDRIDLIVINKEGNIYRVPGASARYPVAPATPVETLRLSTISLEAAQDVASGTLKTTDLKLVRLTMEDLNNLVKRLEQAEYNQAITNLTISTRLGVANSVNLKSIFTDSFANSDRFDSQYVDSVSQMDSINKPVSFQHTAGVVTTAVDTLPSVEGVTLTPSMDRSTNVSQGVSRWIMASSAKAVFMEQTAASSTVNVNEYAAFENPPVMTIAVDQVVAPPNQIVEIQATNGTSISLQANTYSPEQVLALQRQSASVQNVTLGESPRFVQSMTINAYAVGFQPYADNISATVDGVAVNAVPLTKTEMYSGKAYPQMLLMNGADGTGTVNTLTDKTILQVTGASAAALPSSLVGKIIEIKVGNDSYVREIDAVNSGTQRITVKVAFPVVVPAGSTYRIAEHPETTAGATAFNGKTTVKAGPNGTVYAKISIPANTFLTGQREIKLTPFVP